MGKCDSIVIGLHKELPFSAWRDNVSERGHGWLSGLDPPDAQRELFNKPIQLLKRSGIR